MTMRLPWRLFISYAQVIVIGAAVAYVTVRLLAPTLFDHEMGMLGGDHMGMGSGGQGGTTGSVRSAFLSALTTALLVGVLASAAAAALAAAFVTRRLLRPLNAVRATRLIAAGRYQASVPVPREPELAGLAGDVNTLAAKLADTETRRTRLLGEVAHEMRTPLTALEGYMEGLIDGVFPPGTGNSGQRAASSGGYAGWRTTCQRCRGPKNSGSTCTLPAPISLTSPGGPPAAWLRNSATATLPSPSREPAHCPCGPTRTALPRS
jgi:signal transduction histidine kinase